MVRREFVPFDCEIIRKELEALLDDDVAKLATLMDYYEHCGLGNPTPVQIDDYGDGIYRLRHIKPAYQGRLLYFSVDRIAGFERLIILIAYKKEGKKTPIKVLETAKRRKLIWENMRNKK
ncbi:MAG: type II toxin-antitoxin system RelE/ParE family toxin [Armatimonadota bacterium]